MDILHTIPSPKEPLSNHNLTASQLTTPTSQSSFDLSYLLVSALSPSSLSSLPAHNPNLTITLWPLVFPCQCSVTFLPLQLRSQDQQRINLLPGPLIPSLHRPLFFLLEKQQCPTVFPFLKTTLSSPLFPQPPCSSQQASLLCWENRSHRVENTSASDHWTLNKDN